MIFSYKYLVFSNVTRTIVCLLVLLTLSNSAVARMPGGIPSYQSGGTFYHQGIEVTIPDDYMILDVKGVDDRLMVVALKVTGTGKSGSQYRSEVWQFSHRLGNATTDPFSYRQVLISFDSSEGERQRLCLELVLCPQTTALFVRSWGGGKTLLFDQNGTPIGFDFNPQNKDLGDLRGDEVYPLGWLEVVDGRKVSYRLACSLSDVGGKGTFVAVYDLAVGSADIKPNLNVSSKIYWELTQNIKRWK